MQIYLEDYCIYDFDIQKAFKAKYMTENSWTSWEDRKYDENNMEFKKNIAKKN